MLNKFFRKDNKIDFSNFISELKKGKRDFLKILNIPESNFEEASFNELLSNEDDVLSGVNRVQKNFKDIYFNTFNGSLIKHHDNGNIKFIFFTKTNNYKKIISISDSLFTQFGDGIFDDRKSIPFTNHDKIKLLSNGIYQSETDDIVHLWQYHNLSILLQYRTSPLQQFSLFITIHQEREKDTSIRRNGTILDLLSFDINTLFDTDEIHKTIDQEGDKIRFIDYTFSLPKKQLNFFDVITIRIFREDVQTHVLLFSTDKNDSDKMINIVESLVKIYGIDNSKTSELEFHERQMIEENTFWSGRSWTFNEKHSLWDNEKSDEMKNISYEVWVAIMEDEKGFKIDILNYNKLVSLFGING